MKGAILGLPIIGGIIVGVARDNLGKLEPLLAELRQTVDYKVTLNRVVGLLTVILMKCTRRLMMLLTLLLICPRSGMI